MRIGFYLWRITSAKGKSLFSLTQPILPPDDEMGRLGVWSGVGCGWVWGAVGCGGTPDFGAIKGLSSFFEYKRPRFFCELRNLGCHFVTFRDFWRHF